MSAEALAWAMRQTGVTPEQKWFLVAAADSATEFFTIGDPCSATARAVTMFSEQDTNRLTAELLTSEHLVIAHQPGGAMALRLNVREPLCVAVRELGDDHVLEQLIDRFRSTCSQCGAEGTRLDPDGESWVAKPLQWRHGSVTVALVCDACSRGEEQLSLLAGGAL